jgi:chromosomal replication initiation ATPase DnaA
LSAEPTNVLPFPAETKPAALDDLVVLWIDAKRQEDAANALRVKLEQQICELQPAKEEGSSTHELAGGVKLTLTGKLTYKADIAKLQQLAANLPENLRPLKTEVKLDETGAKYLRSKEPQLLMAFDLASIRRGQDIRPPRMFIYGVEGIGKTTFAAGAPRRSSSRPRTARAHWMSRASRWPRASTTCAPR